MSNLPFPLHPAASVAYAHAAMLVPHGKNDQRIVETLAEVVATYTPETQVVLVFWSEDEERLYEACTLLSYGG